MSRRRGMVWQQAFLAATAVAWSGVIANAFAEKPHKWLAILLAIIFAFLLVLDLLLMIFLWRRTPCQRLAPLTALFWFLMIIFVSDRALACLYGLPRGLALLQPPDAILGWAMRPGIKKLMLQMGAQRVAIDTDALGFRNDLPYPADGRIPCAVQGDSNVFGFGLDAAETLCAQINRLLPGTAYNFGVCGYDANHFFFQYERLARRLKPAMRLIVFNTGNDFSAAALATPYYYPRAYLAVSRSQIVRHCAGAPALAVQAYDQRFIMPYAAYDHIIAEPGHAWAEHYPLWLLQRPLGRFLVENIHPVACRWWESAQKRLGKEERDHLDVHYPRWLLLSAAHWPEPFRTYAADFSEILRQIQAQNPRLAICLIPMRSQAVPAKQAEVKAWLRKRGYGDAKLGGNAFASYLAPICEQLGIALIDPLPHFLNHSDPESLYQPGDEHLSALGQALLAEVIAEVLRQRFAECLPHVP